LSEERPTIRLDKWLYFARFFKTRTISARAITGGHFRVNAQKVSKASLAIGPGDTLTFTQADNIRVVEVVDVGKRRGPAPEAQTLYLDKSPPKPKEYVPKPERAGRPSKQDRREALRLKGKTE